MKLTTLHKAALVRAYRTLAQGLGGSAVATALAAAAAALFTDGSTRTAALIAAAATLTSTVVAAFTSFWQGVYRGLPEAEYAVVEPFEAEVTGEQMLRVITDGDELHLPAHVPTAQIIPDGTPTEPVAIATVVARAGKFKQRTT